MDHIKKGIHPGIYPAEYVRSRTHKICDLEYVRSRTHKLCDLEYVRTRTHKLCDLRTRQIKNT